MTLQDELIQTYGDHSTLLQNLQSCVVGDTLMNSKVYSWIGGGRGRVCWARTVWDPVNVPRYSFISWLAMQDRLLTVERVTRIFHKPAEPCTLCLRGAENTRHLFFQCDVSHQVWASILDWLGVQ